MARAVRQQEYRDLLANQGHLQHVIKLLDQIANLDEYLDQEHFTRLKFVVESKFKLISKYVPDLKSVEVTGEGGGPVVTSTLTPEEAKLISSKLEEML